MTTQEEFLHKIYYNPKNAGSFGGLEKLYQTVQKSGRYDISRSAVEKFLKKQETYSMHRSANKKFRRNRVMVTGIDDQWEMDLMDMVLYAKENDNVRYVLLIIDVFSKFIWLRALKNKTGAEVKEAIQDVLNDNRRPSRVRTDKGKEFLAGTIQRFFKEQDIRHFTSHNELKANISERAIKTIKAKIQRYMTYKQTFRFIDHLQDFAYSYNSTRHSSIGMAPENVSKENEVRVWHRLYWPSVQLQTKSTRFKFEVGDYVRLTYLRRTFQREYDQKWTGEIFEVSRKYIRGGLPIYNVQDFNREDIQGSFYQDELQRVIIKDDQLWKVDKILKQRKRKGKTEYLIRWLYWPKSFDSWVDASDIVDI